MIWQATEGTRCDRTALRTHIASEISSSCGDLCLDPNHVQELAQGVSTFCTEQLPDKHVKSDYLMLLTSLSLWAAGEEHAAWRVLGRRSAGAIQRHMVLPPLSPGKLSPSAWSAFACGVLRPSHWVSRSPSVVWVLDLSRIRIGDGELFELTYFRGLRQLLSNLAELWDASRGEGILGVRGIRSQVEQLAGPGAGASRTSFIRKEIREFLQDALGHLAKERAWTGVPRIMCLDFQLS